jgi:hypothetical protein
MRDVASDDEVSSIDDALLQTQLRSIRNTGSTVGGPMPMEPRVLEVIVLGGSSDSNLAVVDAAMAEKAAANKEAAEVAVAEKAPNDIVVVVVKAAAYREAADAATNDVMAAAAKSTIGKEAAGVAMAKKAVDDIVVAAMKAAIDMEAVDEVATKKATYDAALTKGVPEETKRPAALRGSSPPAKRPFRGS